MLNSLEQQERRDVNVRSLVNARGWAGIFNSGYFRNEDSPVIEPMELIPFPDDFDLSRRTISHRTERILERLIKEKKLSPKAISHAVKDNPKLKEALKQ